MSITENMMADFPTFAVIGETSGERICAVDFVSTPASLAYFAFDDEGGLWAMYVDMWHDMGAVPVPRVGRYRVEFSDGRRLNW